MREIFSVKNPFNYLIEFFSKKLSVIILTIIIASCSNEEKSSNLSKKNSQISRCYKIYGVLDMKEYHEFDMKRSDQSSIGVIPCDILNSLHSPSILKIRIFSVSVDNTGSNLISCLGKHRSLEGDPHPSDPYDFLRALVRFPECLSDEALVGTAKPVSSRTIISPSTMINTILNRRATSLISRVGALDNVFASIPVALTADSDASITVSCLVIHAPEWPVVDQMTAIDHCLTRLAA